MKLKLIDFIKEHADWEVLLSQAPYCLKISRDQKFGRNLIMFKYSQQDSDFSNDIVKECRGIILDEDTLEPISVPYFKFFNFSEPNAAEIDWSSAKILEKIDGSLIKVVKFSDQEILVSTHGVIDAFKCELNSQIISPYDNFGELFWAAVRNQMIDCGYSLDKNDPVEWLADKLQFNTTYMFELCSPYSRVIVPHKETKLYFHGWRDNASLVEIRFEICNLIDIFDCPESYNLKSLDECITATQAMSWDEEGYVVLDKNFNRVKIKSPAYCAMHHLKGNGVPSLSRCLEVFLANESNEILAYFPEFKSIFDEIAKRFNEFSLHINSLWSKFNELNFKDMSRKDQAVHIKSIFGKYSGIGFAFLDGKINTIQEHLKKYPIKNLIIMLGLSK